MEVSEEISSCFEQNAVLGNYHNYIAASYIKEAMTNCIEWTLAEAFQLVFQAANYKNKSAFFHILKITLLYIICKETLNTALMRSFDRLSHLNAFMDAHVEKVHLQPALEKVFPELMGRKAKTMIEDGVKKKNEVPINSVLS